MPELPEVETVCRGLAQHLIDKKIVNVTAHRRDLRTPLPDNFEKAILQRKITKITRQAKYVLVHLDSEDVLIIHLGMSGSLVLYDKPPETYRKHDHVIIEFRPYKLLIFHDPRRFGLMALATEKTLVQHPLFSQLGPEPFDTNADYFHSILNKAKAPVKSIIMDQRKIVGVGNIYACEALFRSHIHPARIGSTLTKKETTLLLANIRKTLEEAIVSGGSTLRDYVRSSGDSGYFQHHFQVYGRIQQPCVTCMAPVSVMRQSGRSTFFCAHCQK